MSNRHSAELLVEATAPGAPRKAVSTAATQPAQLMPAMARRRGLAGEEAAGMSDAPDAVVIPSASRIPRSGGRFGCQCGR